MLTRSKILIVALVALIGVAGAALAFWIVSGERVARLAAASPKKCLEANDTRSGVLSGMMRVPGGKFEMGDTMYPEEGPLRTREVKAFWMDAHEVTNDEFAMFVRATGYVTVAERDVDAVTHPDLPPEMRKAGAVVFVMPNDVDGSGDIAQWWQYIAGANWRHPGGPDTTIEGRGDFPVVALAGADVVAYAKWKGRALPTEAQWEWAARGGAKGAPDHEQPKAANSWQGIFPVMNSGDDGFVGLAPVGCYKANAYGLYDMIGNVWEWTRDAYNGDPKRGVIKGGSYLCAPNYCARYRAGARQGQELDLAASHLGFRTVVNE
ncbi:MAG: formylglycine-generating enzyme family protein [Parvibaculum sp.]|nr:formylglycine-generating enzyme family protein [Parvibaculum sp.]